MADKIATDAWVMWRPVAGGAEFFGLYPSEASAKADRDCTSEPDTWRINNLIMIGWGVHKEDLRVFTNDDPKPPTSKTRQ